LYWRISQPLPARQDLPPSIRPYDRSVKAEVMKIEVNGESKEVPQGTTVRSLIELLGLGKAICAAEVNKQVIRRGEQTSRTLVNGDRIELVTLVGGG
jgi:sulfur carrier protein